MQARTTLAEEIDVADTNHYSFGHSLVGRY